MPISLRRPAPKLFGGRNTKAYHLSLNLKLGLILFAVLIAVASLVYTNHLVNRLREREQFVVELWTMARKETASAAPAVNPYMTEFQQLQEDLQTLAARGVGISPEEATAYRQALRWAESMPPPEGEITLASEILSRGGTDIPAIVIDSTGSQPEVAFWQNVRAPRDTAAARRVLLRRVERHASEYKSIPIDLDFGDTHLKQVLYYDESQLIRELRIYPYLQLLFVGLFVLAGYLGFSYVRRSEQSGLWAGMAKEAAHQLGTPISSLMGWHELLKTPGLPPEQEELALDEIDKDINRLRRVANRFSDIGSLPKLDVVPLAPVLYGTADYMRRRIPQQGKRVELKVSVAGDPVAPLNAELFEWVIENLIKNALDAIESNRGSIEVTALQADGKVRVDVRDTGKGVERSQWKNVFRPGYSTKKRGWGLGLSLAKRIIEDYHGGTLALVQSRVGQGTTFRIELPANPGEQA
ncbi:MAG TPA: HAMP domain-containing sensor histidine kinase [Rhodothermales bacterium]|nr:HAMP domain-containing sensor histidine kinase [Rhodothermales bacterium]